MTRSNLAESRTEAVGDEKRDEETMVAGKQTHGSSVIKPMHGSSPVAVIQQQTANNVSLDPCKLTDANLAVAELNKRYAVVNFGNQVMIADEQNDTHPFLTESAFHSLYANVRVALKYKDQSVSRYWFSHPNRRQYVEGTMFDPGGSRPPGYYNLWKGFAVQPAPQGSCPLFFDHVKDVICNGDLDCYEYVLNWLALMIQRPEILPGVAICLLSGQGTGKGEFVRYLRKICGRYLKHLTDRGQIFGRFTDHLDDALLVFADEMHWGGSKDETGMLKVLITEESRSSERKYGAVMAVRNCVHLIVASNEDWAIPAELDDRRFFVLQVSATKVCDHAYFEMLSAEMQGDGPAALLAYLQTRDITSFNPRDFPRTRARVSQQIASLKPIQQWVYELASSGQFPESVVSSGDSWPLKVPKAEFYHAFKVWRNETKLRGPVESKTVLTRALAQFGFTTTKMPRGANRRVQAYNVPVIEILRQTFDQLLGHPEDWEPL